MKYAIRALLAMVYLAQVTAIVFYEKIGARPAFDILVVSILISNTFIFPMLRLVKEGRPQ